VSLRVVTVRSKDEREQFLRLPWKLYDGHATWVPNLLLLQREAIDAGKNPFFEHGEAELFLAQRDGEPVGRITASIDHHHNRYHDENTGFFGFFESVEDREVAGALLDSAEGWLRERGMTHSRGPFSFSLNEEAGMQVDGFEQQAMIAMPQALPYYGALVEDAGYEKAMDLLAYRWDIGEPPERMREAIEKTRAVDGLAVRPVRMRRLKQEVDVLLDIYNDTWRQNWGYVPVTRREAAKLVSDLRLIADKRIVLIAELNGEPAGMVVGLPNLYEAIHDFNGLIDPLKALKLLWRLKARGTRTGRIFLFGVKKKFRTRELVGLPFLLLDELYQASKKARYVWCEQSWVLENNARLNAIMPHWGAYVYKRYRVYEKAL
jgi:hypothetical protein